MWLIHSFDLAVISYYLYLFIFWINGKPLLFGCRFTTTKAVIREKNLEK